MFDIGPQNNIKPRKGKILLAEPFLDDPYFKRTVILLCEHNEEGSFGFVLNNYIDLQLDQINQDLPNFEGKISLGGPVKNTNLYYIHTLGRSVNESIEVLDGIYMGGDFEALKELMQQGRIDENQVRFFVGYSGWSPKQLDEELEHKSWYVADVNPAVLMDTEIDDLWKHILGKMGKKGQIISNLPEDPSLN